MLVVQAPDVAEDAIYFSVCLCANMCMFISLSLHIAVTGRGESRTFCFDSSKVRLASFLVDSVGRPSDEEAGM